MAIMGRLSKPNSTQNVITFLLTIWTVSREFTFGMFWTLFVMYIVWTVTKLLNLSKATSQPYSTFHKGFIKILPAFGMFYKGHLAFLIWPQNFSEQRLVLAP